jgi:hypothetical protein
MVLIWSAAADDDPSVIIVCQLWGIEYIHRPILLNSAFPVGEVVRFVADCRVQLQVWVFPIEFCTPATFFYSSGTAIWDEFTLAESLDKSLCLFFDNPSMNNAVIAQIKSKKVNYTESRVEVITSPLERLDCRKNKCARLVTDRFFIRFVGAKAGMRFFVETNFEKSMSLTGCGRNPIPVWDGNLSYAGKLEVMDEVLACDEGLEAAEGQRKRWILLFAGGGMIAVFMAGCYWVRWKMLQEPFLGWTLLPEVL